MPQIRRGGCGQGLGFPLGFRGLGFPLGIKKGSTKGYFSALKGLWGYGLRGPRAEGFMGLGLWGGFEETRNAQPE